MAQSNKGDKSSNEHGAHLPVKSKVCKTCKKEKPASDFRRLSRSTDKLTANCVECIGERPTYKAVDKQRKKLQEAFIKALRTYGNNIEAACKAVGVTRQTHKNWIANFTEYAQEVAAVEEATHDWVESKMMDLIKKSDRSMIMFYLKTKAKSRGYTERVETINANFNGSMDALDKMSIEELQAYRKEMELHANK